MFLKPLWMLFFGFSFVIYGQEELVSFELKETVRKKWQTPEFQNRHKNELLKAQTLSLKSAPNNKFVFLIADALRQYKPEDQDWVCENLHKLGLANFEDEGIAVLAFTFGHFEQHHQNLIVETLQNFFDLKDTPIEKLVDVIGGLCELNLDEQAIEMLKPIFTSKILGVKSDYIVRATTVLDQEEAKRAVENFMDFKLAKHVFESKDTVKYLFEVLAKITSPHKSSVLEGFLKIKDNFNPSAHSVPGILSALTKIATVEQESEKLQYLEQLESFFQAEIHEKLQSILRPIFFESSSNLVFVRLKCIKAILRGPYKDKALIKHKVNALSKEALELLQKYPRLLSCSCANNLLCSCSYHLSENLQILDLAVKSSGENVTLILELFDDMEIGELTRKVLPCLEDKSQEDVDWICTSAKSFCEIEGNQSLRVKIIKHLCCAPTS